VNIRQVIRALVGRYTAESLPQMRLTPLEEKIYHEGERLIPGVTHDMAEVIRHKTSYEFFRAVIEEDIAGISTLQQKDKISIADFGFGVGHGCYSLARMRKSFVTGLDISHDCLEYAQKKYSASNITYQITDLAEYAKIMPEHDYVVSRGVFEHIPNGLHVAALTKWRCRLLFDVPYNEPAEPNPHHLLTKITEEDFRDFPDAEFFYQDLEGVIYNRQQKPDRPNMIMCACSHPSLPPIKDYNMKFPFPVWRL